MESTLPKRITRTLKPCANEECGRMTRAKHSLPVEGTVVREGRGLCGPCYRAVRREERAAIGLATTKYKITECTRQNCTTMTHSHREPRNNIEGLGTQRRHGDGECSSFYKKGEEVPEERVAQTRRGLESFLARRQARLAREARAAQLRTAFGLAS